MSAVHNLDRSKGLDLVLHTPGGDIAATERNVYKRQLLLKSNEGISNSDYSVGRYYIADPSMMIAGEAYTIQIWGEAEGADFSEALWVYNSGGNTEVSNIQNRVKGVWKQTFKWRNDPNKSNSSLVIFLSLIHI